jgi:hypothetical protein
MDICLQVSLTETYNIVAADAISTGVPVVTSNEIPFVNYFSTVSSNKNVDSIIMAIHVNLRFKFLTKINRFLLFINSRRAKMVWLKFF